MKIDELKEILEKHLHWIREDCEGWQSMRADLYGADLSGANLYGADLRGANLYGADLRGADLRGAKIEDKLIAKFFPICCPEFGEFIGWKKANGYIVKLRIADDAKRSSAFGRKCRCSKAFVIGIETPDGSDSE